MLKLRKKVVFFDIFLISEVLLYRSELIFKVGMKGFWFLICASVRQGQVQGSALRLPIAACHHRVHISISQWCDAVAKGVSGPAR